MMPLSKMLVSLAFSLLLGACVQEAPATKTDTSGGGEQPPANNTTPSVTLTALPATVEFGAASALTWSSTNTEKCEAGGAWSGVKPLAGTVQTQALNAASTFTLTCTGAGVTATQTVQVNVNPPVVPPSVPVITLNASLNTIAYNGSSTLTWSTTNATSCSASGAGSNQWNGSKDTAGSQVLASLTTTGTYTLSCSGTGGSATQSVTVTVQPAPLPTVTLTASPSTVAYNASSTLTWSSTNATACTASGATNNGAWTGSPATSGSLLLTSLKSTGTYTLTCTGAGSSANQSVTITVQAAPVPIVILTASPATVMYNASSTLAWSSTNATTCAASGATNGGAWSGTPATSGSLLLTSLTSTGTYTLTCTGAGGSANQSATVTVTPAPVPAITFSANPSTVSYNGSSTLTWSATNTTLCTGSGAWSGNKATPGSLAVSGLTSSMTYMLSCSGPGGSASQSVTITVVSAAAGSITGSVDSSRINRNGVNKVYLYAGTVTPDDYDGDSGDPIAAATVAQDENACGFSYSFADVVPGNYTIAFTNQAANDALGQNDTLSFIGTANITVGSSALAKNFSASHVLTVGSGKSYATPSAAAAVAASGDVIEIDPGIYQNDIVVWRQNNLTLRGVGGRAHLQGTQMIPYTPGVDTENGMGIWVTNGSGIVVENIEFSGAQVPDQNGAGIRANGNGLTVCNGFFHDNENGILGGGGEVLIEYSEFNHNGFGDGYTHNLYIDSAVTRFVFRHNYTHRAVIGHELKSRAAENHILYNRLMNEDGNASYTIDIPNGGLTYIVGNLIQQGPNTDNSTIVNYGSEGLLAGRTHKLYLANNTLVNDRSAGGIFINAAGGTSAIQVTNNLFVGAGTDVSGPSGAITKLTNLVGSSADLVNRAGYDYHLTGASSAINQGSDPGSVNGFDLRPKYHYLDTAKRSARPSNGNYDIGAYEY